MFTRNCKKGNSKEKHIPLISEQTKALQTLQGILMGITSDGILNEQEVYMLKSWLDNNQKLAGNYPFDVAKQAIEDALEDGILEKCELNYMCTLFVELVNPAKTFSCNEHISENLHGKSICLTGDFKIGGREEVEKILLSKGGEIKKNVVKGLNYLIVGDLGSENYSMGSYGGKKSLRI